MPANGGPAAATQAVKGSTPPPEWEVKLAQLRAENEELQRRKADAEKDRDLFRDLYGKASSHASEVSKENNELLERAELAEGQARDGLAMIRATYEERVRRAEEDAARWKAQYQLLLERDARMDDDIRRRAALEPELRAEVARLREELDSLEEDYKRMEGVLEGLTKEQVEETDEIAETAQAPISSVAGP
ncbi:hypothetical protein BN946_scf184989.g22 [Trametes cinnabarina]|uniref:Uncharacterized protein n=1 Tax=Pycnoporus cinnabarinus TaxID=5643 RepID=A0A060S3K9_PYCCI|nr:hypothetical protein BN946_scf184989.g22 [Trametes cinnabarina]